MKTKTYRFKLSIIPTTNHTPESRYQVFRPTTGNYLSSDAVNLLMTILTTVPYKRNTVAREARDEIITTG
jgi:hypothetical protein